MEGETGEVGGVVVAEALEFDPPFKCPPPPVIVDPYPLLPLLDGGGGSTEMDNLTSSGECGLDDGMGAAAVG